MSFSEDGRQAVSSTTSSSASSKVNLSNDALKALFEEVLEERDECTSKLTWYDDETVEVTHLPGICMHQFALRAERLGKEVSYHKKIFIKVKDK